MSQKIVYYLNILACHIMMNNNYIGTCVLKCKLRPLNCDEYRFGKKEKKKILKEILVWLLFKNMNDIYGKSSNLFQFAVINASQRRRIDSRTHLKWAGVSQTCSTVFTILATRPMSEVTSVSCTSCVPRERSPRKFRLRDRSGHASGLPLSIQQLGYVL